MELPSSPVSADSSSWEFVDPQPDSGAVGEVGDGSSPPKIWWAKQLMSHTSSLGLVVPTLQNPVTCVSSCTGSFAEGFVFEVEGSGAVSRVLLQCSTFSRVQIGYSLRFCVVRHGFYVSKAFCLPCRRWPKHSAFLNSNSNCHILAVTMASGSGYMALTHYDYDDILPMTYDLWHDWIFVYRHIYLWRPASMWNWPDYQHSFLKG